MGTAVMAPWPISDLPRISVTRLSGVMRTQAFSGFAGFFSWSSAAAYAEPGTWKAITSAAPPAAPVFRNSRRFRTGAVVMTHLEFFCERTVVYADVALPAGAAAARWIALRIR